MSYKWVGKDHKNWESREKATGDLKYMSDLSFKNMLYGKVLWAEYPHAKIESINTSKAINMEGVESVITYKDIPGKNKYGILKKDQPVLCEKKTRYLGDAIALVAAESEEIAEKAINLIEVKYSPFVPVVDPMDAVNDLVNKVHPDGNVVYHNTLINGDVEQTFREADVVVTNTYSTSRQMHGYLETESGVGVPEQDGGLTIYCGSQASYRDQAQIAEVMDLPKDKVRVVSSPLGGGFGGKDDITVELYLALLVNSTSKAVKIVLSREESIRTGQKRHPMKIYMKTAATSTGKIIGHKVKIYADTGAYLSLGRSILYLTMEHSTGCYQIPNTHVESCLVYTNNPVSGPMRGFGVNQAIYAVESQVEEIAKKLNLNSMKIRKMNSLQKGDRHPLGHEFEGELKVRETLKQVEISNIWSNRKKLKKTTSRPWIKRGVGIGAAMKCVGFGLGLEQEGKAKIEIIKPGRYLINTSFEDMGQGNISTYKLIGAEVLECSPDNIEVVTGDTANTVDSGVTSASRATFLAGQAIIKAAEQLKNNLQKQLVFKQDKELYIHELSQLLGEDSVGITGFGKWKTPMAKTKLKDYFTSEELSGIPHNVFSFMSQVVLVEVNMLTGKVKVIDTEIAVEAGKVINPRGFKGQIEGGTAMGLGYALFENVDMKDGQYKSFSLSSYLMPTSQDVPAINIQVIENDEGLGPFGAKGVGELACIPVTPAVTNAIKDALGIKINNLPANPRNVLLSLKS